MIQKIPERHSGESRNRGATENSRIGQGTRTLESTDVKVQNVSHGK